MHGSPPTSSGVLASILERASYLTIAGFDMQEALHGKIESLLCEGVGAIKGDAARQQIEDRGLAALHEFLPAEEIGALRDFVMPQIRPDLLTLSCRIGRKLLGMEGEFFVDDYTILRINYPYEVALRAADTSENPGTGRVSKRTREAGSASRAVDPTYDPKTYHNNEPPAAWAHGAHQDTWFGHSRFGVNLWWAVSDVPEECAMVFYPQTFGRRFEPDPCSLYLRAGQPLPAPSKMALRRGEMLIFNPEMLHATHLNISNRTRIAVSARLNPAAPKFSASCFFAREFWHSSTNIEAGRLDDVIRFKREENLEPVRENPAASAAVPRQLQTAAVRRDGSWTAVCRSENVGPRQKLLLQADGKETVLLVRGERRLHAVESRCAHLNISMADGYHDERSIWCPAHAVKFSLATGKSACALLALRTFEVREADGVVWLRRPAAQGSRA